MKHIAVQVKVFPSCNMIVNRGFKPNPKVSEVIQHYMNQLPEGITEQIGITTTYVQNIESCALFFNNSKQ